jgi:hypothetical protein
MLLRKVEQDEVRLGKFEAHLWRWLALSPLAMTGLVQSDTS